MEERVSHPPKSNHGDIEPPFLSSGLEPPPSSTNNEPFQQQEVEHERHAGVYVVQVPKVQIYRVPPPENAKFVEQFRNANPQKRRCSKIFTKCFVLGFIVVLILGICAALAYLALKPKSPTFSVEHLTMKNIKSHSRHQLPAEYHISLECDNPNDRLSIIYEKGGSAELSFKNHKIATGKTHAMTLNSQDSEGLELVLAGTKDKLPSEIEKGLEGSQKKKTKVGLLLTVRVPMKMEIGFVKLWSMEIAIECDFQVNTLSGTTHVMDQKCKVKVGP